MNRCSFVLDYQPSRDLEALTPKDPKGPLKDPIIRYSGLGFRVPLKGSIRGLEDFKGPKDPIIRYSGLG